MTRPASIYSATVAEVESLIAAKFSYVVWARYAHSFHEKGDIISVHRSLTAAHRAAKGDFRQVMDSADLLERAREIEMLIQ